MNIDNLTEVEFFSVYKMTKEEYEQLMNEALN